MIKDKNDLFEAYDDNEGKAKDLIMKSEKIKVHGINLMNSTNYHWILNLKNNWGNIKC